MSQSVEMTRQECWERLVSGIVGRVAMATPVGPRIVPVAYVVHEDAIVFRTAPYSELSTYGWNTELAFQVDWLDYESRRGWSVVATGRAMVVDDPGEVQRIRRSWEPQPWVAGSRNLFVKLPWRQLTGLRLGGDWTSATRLQHERAV